MTTRLLQKSQLATAELDRLIYQMEATMGKTHSVSPFTQMYTQYGISTNPKSETASIKGTQDSEVVSKKKVPTPNANQQQKKGNKAPVEAGKETKKSPINPETAKDAKENKSSGVEEVKEDPTTFERIKAKLEELGIEYKLTVHEPVKTS